MTNSPPDGRPRWIQIRWLLVMENDDAEDHRQAVDLTRRRRRGAGDWHFIEPTTFRLRVGPMSFNETRPEPSWLLSCGTHFIPSRPVPAGISAWVATRLPAACIGVEFLAWLAAVSIRSQSDGKASELGAGAEVAAAAWHLVHCRVSGRR